MKSILLIALCASLVLYAGDTFPQSDEICCTWINTQYEPSERPQKMIFNYDGTFESYRSKQALDPILRGVFQIVAKWTDAEGSIWYKIKMFDKYGTKHNLVRISKDGDKLEFVRKTYDYPETIDRDASNYSTYSRTVLK